MATTTEAAVEVDEDAALEAALLAALRPVLVRSGLGGVGRLLAAELRSVADHLPEDEAADRYKEAASVVKDMLAFVEDKYDL